MISPIRKRTMGNTFAIVMLFFFIWLPVLGGVLFRIGLIPFRPYEFALLGIPCFLFGCIFIIRQFAIDFWDSPIFSSFIGGTLLIVYACISYLSFIFMSVIAFGIAFEDIMRG